MNCDNLTYYFKDNTARKKCDDFNNGIELSRKIQSGEIKLEEAKKLQNEFKSNLNEILRAKYKSGEQKMALESIKLLYESRQDAVKLFNDYSSVVFDSRYKIIHGKRVPCMLARVDAVAKASDH